MGFTEIVVIYILVVFTVLCKSLYERLLRRTFDVSLTEALNYSKTVVGKYSEMDNDKKELYMRHAMGYIRLNYSSTLRGLGMYREKDSEKLCSMLISKLSCVDNK